MEWIIPGTTLTGQREEADRIGEQFQALFLAGGLSLSQVSAITGLEPYTVQNWVKRRLLPPPESKKIHAGAAVSAGEPESAPGHGEPGPDGAAHGLSQR